MRFALLIGAFFSFVTGLQVFVLTDHTADLFAWTIASGVTATLLGSFYWTASVIALLSWRRQPWVRARVGIPGVVVFLWATLLATLLHLDLFHLSSGGPLARGAAWIWLVVYIADPILVTVALVIQWRTPGADPPRTAPLPPLFRGFLGVVAVLYGLFGTVLFFFSASAIEMAAWPLTPLTSQVIGAVTLGGAGVLATMWWENDADRMFPASVGFIVAPILLVLGAIRYSGEFTGGFPTVAYAGLALGLAIAGIGGVLTYKRHLASQPGP